MHQSSFEKMSYFKEKHLGSRIHEPLVIMDLGSQNVNGSYKSIFDLPAWKYIGVDMVPGEDVDIVLSDPYSFREIESESIDVLISGQTFEHIEFFWITMREITRVLKPGALCCIVAPSAGPEHRYPTDCWRFYPDGFRALARYANLEILEVSTEWEPRIYKDGSENKWKDSFLVCRKPYFSHDQSRGTMKILYVMRSAAHFHYHSSTIKSLCKWGHEVTALFDEPGSKRTVNQAVTDFQAETAGFQYDWLIRRSDTWRVPVFHLREVINYDRYLGFKGQSFFYLKRWRTHLPEWLKFLLQFRITKKMVHYFLGSKRVKRGLRFMERIVPPDPGILRSLTDAKPDIVVASPANMRYSEELEYVKAANRLNIPTVVPILSWDNLTTKGVFHEIPRLTLAWNRAHLEEARDQHGIPEDRIVITGSPVFDFWFEMEGPSLDYKTFCCQVGLDPSHPLIVYLGSSANISQNESWLVNEFIKVLRNSQNESIQKAGVLIRPHPANAKCYENVSGENIAIWPKDGQLPDTQEGKQDFFNALHCAFATVGVNTSGMIDATIMDKPCVAIMPERYKQTQEQAIHFKHLIEADVLYFTPTITGAVDVLGNLFRKQDPKEDKRHRFVRDFIRPWGEKVQAGQVAALAIEMAAMNRSAAQIKESILQMSKRGKYEEPVLSAPNAASVQTKETSGVPGDLTLSSREPSRESREYRNYQYVLERVLRMKRQDRLTSPGVSAPSQYWSEELENFDYMMEASPLIIRKLRHHTYHITGLRVYDYRSNKDKNKTQTESKLAALQALDKSGLLVPESPALGGFGHRIKGALYNVDTLKFYEVLIGIDRSGVLDHFRRGKERRMVWEIGAGWGGFAYQFKTLFPNTTYLILDLPEAMLFSATYLKTLFPNARILIFGDIPEEETLKNWQRYDFIFIPNTYLERMAPERVDLTVNMVSFQEMTTEQARAYAKKSAGLSPYLYSLNRPRSLYNVELSDVASIVGEFHEVSPVHVLDVDYTQDLSAKSKPNPMSYRHILGVSRMEFDKQNRSKTNHVKSHSK